MRVPANQLEKILDTASREVEATFTGRASRESLDTLVAAFKRAAELRSIPFKHVTLKGRNSNVPRPVVITTTHKTERGNDYALCIVPYTDAEKGGARRPFSFETEICGEDGKPSGKFKKNFLPIIPTVHIQWIRTDRLKDAA